MNKSVFVIAFKNLFKEKGRLLITVGGVTFSVILILLLLGLYAGWSTQVKKFLGGIEAEFWVGSKGSSDLSHGISILPRKTIDQLESIEGIEKVTPFVGRQISFELDGQEAHVYLIGQDEGKIIKPYKIVKGSSNLSKGQIIIDEAFAQENNLTIGDKLIIQGVELKITGISRGGNLLAYTYAISTQEDAREALNANDYTNYFIISAPSAKGDRIAQEIKNKSPDLEIISKESFLESNSAIVKDSFLPIIAVLLIIAFVIGISVIGLTIYTSVIEKNREYGVLKALGYTNFQLFYIAVTQALIAGGLGLVIGNILAPLIARLASEFVGGFIYELNYIKILAFCKQKQLKSCSSVKSSVKPSLTEI